LGKKEAQREKVKKKWEKHRKSWGKKIVSCGRTCSSTAAAAGALFAHVMTIHDV